MHQSCDTTYRRASRNEPRNVERRFGIAEHEAAGFVGERVKAAVPVPNRGLGSSRRLRSDWAAATTARMGPSEAVTRSRTLNTKMGASRLTDRGETPRSVRNSIADRSVENPQPDPCYILSFLRLRFPGVEKVKAIDRGDQEVVLPFLGWHGSGGEHCRFGRAAVPGRRGSL